MIRDRWIFLVVMRQFSGSGAALGLRRHPGAAPLHAWLTLSLCAGISARGIFSLCWNTQSLCFISWIISYFYFIPRSFRKCLFIFSSLPPFLCNFLFVCFPFSFKSVSQLPTANLTHQPSSWSQTSSSSLRTQKCGFYSNGQIVMRTMKITRKDLIFLKQNSVLILSVYVFVGE